MAGSGIPSEMHTTLTWPRLLHSLALTRQLPHAPAPLTAVHMQPTPRLIQPTLQRALRLARGPKDAGVVHQHINGLVLLQAVLGPAGDSGAISQVERVALAAPSALRLAGLSCLGQGGAGGQGRRVLEGGAQLRLLWRGCTRIEGWRGRPGAAPPLARALQGGSAQHCARLYSQWGRHAPNPKPLLHLLQLVPRSRIRAEHQVRALPGECAGQLPANALGRASEDHLLALQQPGGGHDCDRVAEESPISQRRKIWTTSNSKGPAPAAPRRPSAPAQTIHTLLLLCEGLRGCVIGAGTTHGPSHLFSGGLAAS